ncbi:hypothetical protein CEXT_406541 [Caerostris extrusa]|uniref:Uncharacterized protein n=1 Tax=Caerostris extrusa TaxID=172846 RepID=A0AAV4QB70_CAEEX|nr:hypothetical protein CEXT_406541 [Caerostris extrusa]
MFHVIWNGKASRLRFMVSIRGGFEMFQPLHRCYGITHNLILKQQCFDRCIIALRDLDVHNKMLECHDSKSRPSLNSLPPYYPNPSLTTNRTPWNSHHRNIRFVYQCSSPSFLSRKPTHTPKTVVTGNFRERAAVNFQQFINDA